MSFTQGQIDALKAAISSGTQRVTYEGKTVEYRSIAEMVQALGMMQREVNSASGSGRETHFNPSYDRGT
jgi:hypothetical protein